MKKIDFEWYLTQQVHAAIIRLCEFFEETNSSRIADCLGKELIKLKKIYYFIIIGSIHYINYFIQELNQPSLMNQVTTIIILQHLLKLKINLFSKMLIDF